VLSVFRQCYLAILEGIPQVSHYTKRATAKLEAQYPLFHAARMPGGSEEVKFHLPAGDAAAAGGGLAGGPAVGA
jgi:hypothetical protein